VARTQWRKARWTTTALAACAWLALACGSEDDPAQDPGVARGEKIYRNICVVCHNADPNQAGVQGPAIAHATRELLEFKVLRGEYPPGHTPERDTKQMPVFDYLGPNLDDIEAFLASRRK
jgi:mono/diheme cytochrome c family protein